MNTRDRILARLRAAPRPPLPEPDIAGFYAASPPAGLPQQLAQWARSMKSYQGQVVWCHAHDWEDALLQQLRSRQVRRLLLARQTAHGARTLAALARLQSLQALYAAWPDAEHIARKEDCTVNGNVLDYTVTYTVAADICG